MRYSVELAPAAARQLRKLDRNTQSRILSCLEGLQSDPRPQNSLKLQGSEDLYRVRTGDMRILYQILDQRLLVLVVKIGNRRDVYKNL
jgi:mRNA interferase RelE/StbE